MNQFWLERNIQHIFGTPYNPQHQGAIEAFNRTVQDFLTLAKVHQKYDYSLDNSICDFLLYYNERLHSTTKVSPFKVMMNASDKELMENIRKNTIKRRLKAKTVSETYPNGSYIRVSNYIKIIDKEHVIFILQEDYKSPS